MGTVDKYVRTLTSPWRLSSLAIGLALLIAGAYYFNAPDWDVPVSLLMAVSAYLTAGWSMRVILDRQWAWWPLMVFLTWLTVDGVYAAYWAAVDPQALALMRDVNWPASLSLYWMCGLVWLFPSALRRDYASGRRTLPL